MKKITAIILLLGIITLSFISDLFGGYFDNKYDTQLFWGGYFLSYPYIVWLFFLYKEYDYSENKITFLLSLLGATLLGLSTFMFFLFFTLKWLVFPLAYILTIMYIIKLKNEGHKFIRS